MAWIGHTHFAKEAEMKNMRFRGTYSGLVLRNSARSSVATK